VTRWRATRAVAFAVVATAARNAAAQTLPATPPVPPAAAAQAPAPGVRARFGIDFAVALARSTDPDERLRSMERIAAVHTNDALSLLVRAAQAAVPGAFDPRLPIDGVARKDPRALLVVVRALATWLDREEARSALASIVGAPVQSFASRSDAADSADPAAEDAEGAARILLARQEAAIALAESGNVPALEALIAKARSTGPGQAAALDALAIHPPAQSLLGGVVLTTPPAIWLAVGVGDLRSLDAVGGALSASDPALRAAALASLGTAGDGRIVDAARTALHDPDARVRAAAGEALVRLETPDAATAVEAIIGDDATALDGLRLAQLVQNDGVIKAAAARATATANVQVRAAAVAALGRQAGVLALSALSALATNPALQGDVGCALARSPSGDASSAIASIANTGALRRLAVRAYLTRRLARAERSRRLDALTASLAASRDAIDRSVGVQALVAFGERSLDLALQDPDPRVRRAAAMGALWHGSAERRSTLLAHMATETDDPTRQVLALGLDDGDAAGVVPTAQLSARARAGGADAPLAALALARRAESAQEVEAMLASHDPVLRAHVARGLGAGTAHDAVGYLVRAYAPEADVGARRAIVTALSARTGGDAASPARDTLRVAARLDPDPVTRWVAARALSMASGEPMALPSEVAWVRLAPAEGAAMPRELTATLMEQSGLALPVAFDDEGYAIVPGVAAGDARLRLAPRLPPYDAAQP
jgi:hypothetical protein